MKRIRTALGLAIAMALALACTSSTPATPTSTPTAPPTRTADRTTSPSPAPLATATARADLLAAPVPFTGVIICGPALREETKSTIVAGDGVTLTRNRAGAWQQTVRMSDARLQGTTHHTYETDSYGPPGTADGPSISAATRRIENAGGSWVGRWYEATDGDGQQIGDEPFVLVGEGGYQGLIAIYKVTRQTPPCAVEITGLIFGGMSEPTLFAPE